MNALLQTGGAAHESTSGRGARYPVSTNIGSYPIGMQTDLTNSADPSDIGDFRLTSTSGNIVGFWIFTLWANCGSGANQALFAPALLSRSCDSWLGLVGQSLRPPP